MSKRSVINFLMLDHRYLKDCCKIMKGSDEDKKNEIVPYFLDALVKHSVAEEKVVYHPLVNVAALRDIILEGEDEHKMLNSKIHSIMNQIKNKHVLDEELFIQLKVLAEFLEHHLKEEEEDLFPDMKKVIAPVVLAELGIQYLKARKFSLKDLSDYPEYQKMVRELNPHAHISPHLVQKVEEMVLGSAVTRQ